VIKLLAKLRIVKLRRRKKERKKEKREGKGSNALSQQRKVLYAASPRRSVATTKHDPDVVTLPIGFCEV